MIQVQYKNI